MCNSDVVRSQYECFGFGGPSYVRYSGCSSVWVVRAGVRYYVSIAFDEICAVVLNKNGVQVLGFVGQTVV